MDDKVKAETLWELEQKQFIASDNTQLVYRVWQPKQKTDKVLLILHRGHEHSGRLLNVVEELGLDDHWVFAWDQRGHGLSPGERGYADDYKLLVNDLDTFVKHIATDYGLERHNMVVIANSIGAVLASNWVHDYAPGIKAMVLVAPAFSVKLYIPLAIPALRLLNKVKHPAYVKSYVKAKMLTHDKQEAEAYKNDELISPKIAVNILLGLHDAGKRIVKNAGAITTPTLVLSAGKDWVVRQKPQQAFFERLSTSDKAFHVLEDFYHGVLYEKDRSKALDIIREFIENIEARAIAETDWEKEDRQGYSHYQYQKLLCSPGFLKGASFWFQKQFIKLNGKLSEGIQTGLEYGFDSGLALDYVYENEAKGKGPVGRFVDRQYLNAIGWRGIRERRVDLSHAIEFCIDRVFENNSSMQIFDIATGGGRYLLETVARNEHKDDIGLVLHDLVQSNLDKAQQTAAQLELNTVKTQQQDLREEVSEELTGFADLGLCSGIFELIHDNETVMQGLNKLATIVHDKGYLIYTSQTWHPQVEMIARCLPNHQQQAWRMRLRTQAEMDGLVRKAGFDKIETFIGLQGIFNVSIARRTA